MQESLLDTKLTHISECPKRTKSKSCIKNCKSVGSNYPKKRGETIIKRQCALEEPMTYETSWELKVPVNNKVMMRSE